MNRRTARKLKKSKTTVGNTGNSDRKPKPLKVKENSLPKRRAEALPEIVGNYR
jgi:hypothetical protein